MEDLRNAGAGRRLPRHSKALPVPPPIVELGVRGRVNPFPSANRELPPIPKTSMSSIPRRPVGAAAGAGKADSIESPKVQDRSIYEQFMRKESMDHFQTERTPAPPPKDNKSRELPGLPGLPEPPTHLHSNSTSSISSTKSSPRPEIWKRRSPKGDRSPSISELKLTKSNGSTASLASVSQSSPGPAPQHSLPPLPAQTAVVGLPGRAIKKPIPARPAPPQPAPMGNQLSKGPKLGKKYGAGEAENSNITRKLAETQVSPYTRLPTPDYQSNENQVASLLVPPVISPVSPETPPRDMSPDRRQDFAQPPDKKASPIDHEVPSLLVPGPPRPDRESSLALNIIDEYAIPRSPRPQNQSVSSISTVRPPPPPSQDVKAWPSITDTPETPGTIHPSAALSIIHLNCYHSHRQMRSSRNDICPLGCMICQVKDTEKRWTCTWCSLRCCEPCTKGLETTPGKDLGKFLEWIGRSDRLHERQVSVGS